MPGTCGYALKDESGNLIGVPGMTIPAGLIVMWSGTLATIPTGWALCDGQDGRPDLRDKFIKGAASGQNPGASGGSATHTHDAHAPLAHSGAGVADHPALPHSGTAVGDHAALTHTGTAVSAHTGCAVAAHTTVSNKQGASTGTVVTTATHTVTQPSNHTVTQPSQHAAQSHSVTQPGQHAAQSHVVTQPVEHASQSHASANSEPVYFTLAFIIKL